VSASALLVGLGPADDVTLDGLRTAAALVAQRASESARVATTLADAAPADLDRAAVGQAIAEGVLLGSYSFDEYRATKKATKLRGVTLLVDGGTAAVKKGVARGEVVAGAVAWARDMVNTPARELSPDQFAKAAQQLLRGKNVKVEVFDVAALKRQKLGGIRGVGQGS
jgi:leucyl aminopeptidase